MKEKDTSKKHTEEEKFKRTLIKFSIFHKSIQDSKFFIECCDALSNFATEIKNIRCLALGSPVNSTAALYQFAFTIALGDFYNIEPQNISFYDPIFDEEDRNIIEDKFKCVLEEEAKVDSSSTLFFLPHASLEVTENFLNSTKPIFFLANNLISHTDRLTKRKLFDLYNTIALLVKLLEEKNIIKIQDGFVKAKPKKRRIRTNNNQTIEISYDYSKSYFKDINSTKFKEMEDTWGNAFSDLAFHHIVLSNES